jgi:hypothetical protein
MLLFYVDESGGMAGHTGEHRRHHDLFSLAAVGIHDESRAPLAEDLHAIRLRHLGKAVDSGEWKDTEIKARYLWLAHESISGPARGKLPEPYRPLVDRAKLNLLLFDIEKVFAKFRPVVLAAIVDKPRLGDGAHPIGAAYASLYQSAVLMLENVYGGSTGAFVADEQHEHEAHFASGAMRAAREAAASRGKYRPNFNLVLDKPLWIDSRLSTWDREIIQLADLAAFATRAWAAAGAPPSERHFLWRAIEPCLATDWRKGTGVRGAGLSLIPDPGNAFPTV